jgi:hypothetical protein
MHHSAVRVSTRCLRRSVRPYGARGLPRRPRGCGDLGLQGPPESDATMMQLIPLRGLHHHCACWYRDASGSSRLHRVHHRLTQRAAPGPHRGCEGRAGSPRHWPRHASHLAFSRSRCTSCIPAPEDGCSCCRQLARHPRGTPTRRHAADVAGTRLSRRPAEAPDLALPRCPGDHTVITNPGVADSSPLRLRYSAWLVILSLPVSGILATRATPTAAARPAPRRPTSAPASPRSPPRWPASPTRSPRRTGGDRYGCPGCGRGLIRVGRHRAEDRVKRTA